MNNEIMKQSCIEFAKNPTAAGVVWSDITTYSKSDKERIPNVFSTMIGDVRISIVCGHIYYPEQWIFNCYSLGIKEEVLKDVTHAHLAAHAAIRLCKKKVMKWADTFKDYAK